MTRSLEGRVVLVTRPRAQGAELARLLEERGATAVAAPTIDLHPAEDEEELARSVVGLAEGRFSWLVVTSRAGVEALARAGLGPVKANVAAVGEGTARALRERGVEPALVPSTYTTEALADAMPEGSGEVLLARADIAPEGLEDALAAKGWTPVRVDAYRTALARELPEEARGLLDEGGVDAVTFTSASTVEGFADLARPARWPRVVCIGPVTAERARRAAIPVDAVAEPHTIGGLVAALERVLGPSPKE